tara:strand:- start:76 stop:594 length:519 start_codon:yes stop_codon:yes gene_type:complete
MSQKNKKQKRSFIPQAVGDALKKINRNFTSKFGKIEFIIQSNWSEIAGSYFSEYSEPKNIVRIPDYENELGEQIYKNHLNVSVAPAAALEFQHFKDKLLEKINSYFGYKAIINLRIQQNYIPKSKMDFPKTKKIELSDTEKENILDTVDKVTNNDLKKSLFDLGKNIIKEVK